MEFWLPAVAFCNNWPWPHQQLHLGSDSRLSGIWIKFRLDSYHPEQSTDCFAVGWRLGVVDSAEGQLASVLDDLRFSFVFVTDGSADLLFELEGAPGRQERPLQLYSYDKMSDNCSLMYTVFF